MAILHMVSEHLDETSLTHLLQRSSADDGYVFMDDGVYVLLGQGLSRFNGRSTYVMHCHALERGLSIADPMTGIDMAELVHLTASYASSMSW
ncbi:MAG: hypothetical protein PSN46_03875 [Gammaproteobacteria bacterium]|nr:hypothetical protein [Gammaproteobacteria bacterium]